MIDYEGAITMKESVERNVAQWAELETYSPLKSESVRWTDAITLYWNGFANDRP